MVEKPIAGYSDNPNTPATLRRHTAGGNGVRGESQPGAEAALSPRPPQIPQLNEQFESFTQRRRFPELRAWHEALERHASQIVSSDSLNRIPPIDFQLGDALLQQIGYFKWPSDLYIPAAAPSVLYDVGAACPPSNRYTAASTEDGLSTASFSTGALFAQTAAKTNDTLLTAQANVGFLFSPLAKLAVYSIQPQVTALGHFRWDIATTQDWGGAIRERGILYTSAWVLNPVDGTLSLAPPFGAAVVFDQSELNQGGIPITDISPPWGDSPPATKILLQGAHTYLIAVSAAVRIDNSFTDPHGTAIPWPVPNGTTWHVWCSLECTVTSVTLDVSTVYMP